MMMNTAIQQLITVWLLLSGLVVADARAALPTGVREALPVNDQCLRSRYERYSLYSVTVLAIDDAGATNEHPPQGKVDVHEIFRGPGRMGPVEAVWQTFPTSADYDGTGPGAKVKPDWYRMAVKAPPAGARVILCGYYDEARNILEVAEGHTFEDTPANRETLNAHMAPPERDPQQQLVLAGILVALPVLNGILVAVARKRKPALWASLILALGTTGLYFFYEAGYSARTDIRIDLLLIWPLLIFNFALGVFSLMKLISGVRTGLSS